VGCTYEWSLKTLPVLSEENEIALIVKRDGTSALELWIVREQRGKYSGKRSTKPCVEVVENHFRNMTRHLSTPLQSQQTTTQTQARNIFQAGNVSSHL